jgi:hypothetical protein
MVRDKQTGTWTVQSFFDLIGWEIITYKEIYEDPNKVDGWVKGFDMEIVNAVGDIRKNVFCPSNYMVKMIVKGRPQRGEKG